MPYGDRKGPFGVGPRSGRGLGYCSGYDSPGYTKPSARIGIGRGRAFNFYGFGRCFGFSGRGRGWRNMFYATGLPGWMRYPFVDYPIQNPQEEREFLKSTLSALEKQMETIKNRLDEIEENDKKK